MIAIITEITYDIDLHLFMLLRGLIIITTFSMYYGKPQGRSVLSDGRHSLKQNVPAALQVHQSSLITPLNTILPR
jgi:hypothetical protein